jgi:hypothetical protein
MKVQIEHAQSIHTVMIFMHIYFPKMTSGHVKPVEKIVENQYFAGLSFVISVQEQDQLIETIRMFGKTKNLHKRDHD